MKPRNHLSQPSSHSRKVIVVLLRFCPAPPGRVSLRGEGKSSGATQQGYPGSPSIGTAKQSDSLSDIAVAVGPRHPFTAPKVRPVTMWRWMIRVRRMTGRVIKVAAAARGPQLISSYPIMLKTAMGRVRVFRPARITENRKLFQEKMKLRMAVATIPGLTRGTATRSEEHTSELQSPTNLV